MCAGKGEVVTHTQVIREWIKSLQSLSATEFHSFSASVNFRTTTEWTMRNGILGITDSEIISRHLSLGSNFVLEDSL